MREILKWKEEGEKYEKIEIGQGTLENVRLQKYSVG